MPRHDRATRRPTRAARRRLAKPEPVDEAPEPRRRPLVAFAGRRGCTCSPVWQRLPRDSRAAVWRQVHADGCPAAEALDRLAALAADELRARGRTPDEQ